MSEQQQPDKNTPARRAQLRIRVEKLRQSRKRSLLGVAELAGLAASALLLLAVVFAYFLFLRPAGARLDAAQLKREETYAQLRKMQEGLKLNTDKQVTIAEITQSVQDFEANRLSTRGQGRLTLLDTINKLIRSNSLRNTSGPNYSALDALAAGTTQGSVNRTGNAKWQSLYPGLGITVTVEGQYPNLRRFVRELELSNQFIIINAVELEKATESSAAAAAAATATIPGEPAKPPARSALVSLRLDMAAYFRREAATDAAETVPATETR
jgi:Tfp pilus assembly protein PilO